ncbi:hypothetical protein EX30DRAFT_395678 [Ascodesmis nigricans]|uniref:Phosphoglucomutase-2 n=1 Tax=Ascodesmis nigricans TaxID=341454 RepID=A0A4S2MWW7_9PEZI|nr:hypothetical protein EX30DRAFT_395678 [Ascodesmis nigricans]
MDPVLRTLVDEWLRLDKNGTTRAEIQSLVAVNNVSELQKLLGTRIEFGTAGLRARMQAGFSRMNDLTVIQASQGLASYILEQNPSGSSIVIGHDHRHNSARFARLAAGVMISRGIKVYFYDTLVHTPMVPFGVDYFKASAGLMITASHNPALDNGYKVYWSNGCQIVPPHDIGIAAAIERNLEVTCWDADLVDNSPELVEKRTEEVKVAYFEAVQKLVTSFNIPPLSFDFKFVYTPMHGVGLPFMTHLSQALGLEAGMSTVPEQASPDPDFPTVRFPNPEEKGALDLAVALAKEKRIPLVIASDPDADRFSAAQWIESSSSYRIFTGNELGILFASFLLDCAPKEALHNTTMLCSTVSSQMLKSMAQTEGFTFEETLTGFKWLGSRAIEIGNGAIYAFEEAIGYMFSPVVHDKDGISAAAVFITAARHWASQGLSPYDKLQQLYAKYGHFQSANGYLVSPEPATTKKVFAGIRALGATIPERRYPERVGQRKILWWRDLTEGFDSNTSDGMPRLPVSKSSEMITCELEDEVRFTVRGSGTEPKIKMYIESRAESESEARRRAQEVYDDLVKEWFRPEETGLVAP